PGMDPGILDYVADHYKVVVIETYGVGGLPFPEHRNFMERMETLANKGVLVVISTQVAMEGSDLGTYEVGVEAMERYFLLQAYDMTTEAAVTKLMWLLGLDLPKEEFKKAFYTPIAHDTVPFTLLK
nr:L-asparaginase 1 [Clostridiales bacterium]